MMYITKKIKMEENLVSDTENIVSEERKTEDKIKGFENSIHSQDLLTSELLIKKNKKRVRYGIITIVGLIIQKLEFAVLSSINSLSIYYTAFLSYKDNSIKLENSITLGSLLTFAQFSSIWSGGVLNKFIHIRLIIIIGGILFLLSSLGIIFLESLLGYKFMMVLYGVGIGIQEGITYGNASSFIPEKKGLINGLANVSWTLFCSFFNYIGLHIVNPDGLDVQLYEDNGISKNIIKYTIITIILFAAGTVGTSILTISYKKGDYEYLNNNEQSENNENEEDNKKNIISDNNNRISENTNNIKKNENKISFLVYLKCLRFYTCFFMCCLKNIHTNLVSSSFMLFSFHYKTVSADTQKYITSSSFIVNLVFTLVLSLFIDKFKYRTIVIPSNIICLMHALTFQFIIKNETTFIIYYFISNIFSSIENLATFPHILKVFGIDYGVIIFGIYYFGTGLSNYCMNIFVDYILSRYNENETEKYDKAVSYLFYMTSCFTLMSIVFMSFENENSVLS